MAGLKIKINVDAAAALQGLKKTTDGLDGVASGAKKAGDALGNTFKGQGILSIASQLKTAQAELRKVVAKFGELSPEADAAAVKVAQLKKVIEDAAQATQRVTFKGQAERFASGLATVGSVAGNVAAGLTAIGYTGKNAEKAILKLQGALAFASVIGQAAALGTALQSIGLIGTRAFQAITVAIGETGLGLLVIGVGVAVTALISSLSKLEKQVKDPKWYKDFIEGQKSFKDSVEKASSAALAQGISLQRLVSIAGDSTKSAKQQKEAFNQLNEGLSQYGIKVDQASIKNGNAKTAVEALTNGLIQQAIAAKQADRIAELIIKRTEIQNKLNQNQAQTVQDNADRLKLAQENARKFGISLEQALAQLPQIGQSLSQAATDTLRSELSATNNQINTLTSNFNDSSAAGIAYATTLKSISGVSSTTTKETKDLQREVLRLDFRKFIGEAKYLQLFGGQIERLKFRLETLQQLKLKAKTSVEVEEINKKIEEVQSYLDRAENGVFIPLQPRVVIPTGGLIQKSDKEKAQDEIDKTFGDIFESAAENGIGSAAEAFGTALAEGGDIFAALGQSALTSLGDFAVNVGKELLKIAITFEAIRKAFSSLGAGGKIAVAFALIAVGSAIKASVSKNAKKLATGGFIDGPGTSTSDSIPARLSRGEYVIRARSVSKYGKDFFDKFNKGIPPPEPWRAIVNRSMNPFEPERSRALVNRGGFAQGGYVDPFASYSRALVNRFEAPPIFQPEPWRALVNRPMPQVPTVRTGTVSMGSDTTLGTGVIAETKISGQDLKIILSRADRRYSNVT